MALRRQFSPQGSMAFDPAVPGRASVRLVNGVATYFVDLIVRATVTMDATAAGTVRNRGSVLSLFSAFGLAENGRERVRATGAPLRVLAEMSSRDAMPAKRLASVVASEVTTLEELVRISFSTSRQLSPAETHFREADARQVLEVFAELSPTAVANLVGLTAGTATLSDISVSVAQSLDKYTQERPVFIPTMRQITEPIASANPNQITYIKSAQYVRALVLSQVAGAVGEVGDILKAVSLRGDYRDLIGPRKDALPDLLTRHADLGGWLYATDGGEHLAFDFALDGRLGNIVSPVQDLNLRLESDVAPTAAAGATSSALVLTLVEYERTPGLVSDAVPFAV